MARKAGSAFVFAAFVAGRPCTPSSPRKFRLRTDHGSDNGCSSAFTLKTSRSAMSVRQPEGDRKGSKAKGSPAAPYYRVHLSSPAAGFEFGEHLLSKQLIFVFSRIPPLEFAAMLEAIGFDHSSDERTFTTDASAATRRKAHQIALQFSPESQGRRR